MFDVNHDLCFLECVNDVNVRSKSKYAKSSKRKNTWKPIGKIFTYIGYRWKPTGRTFTIVGNTCPLTRIASSKVKPLNELVTTPNPKIQIYRRKTKVAKSVYLSSEPSILGSSCLNCSLVFGLRMLQAYDRKPLPAQQLCSEIHGHAVATTSYIQNRSLIRKRHNKTPYELLHNRKPDLSYRYIFDALCYLTNDSEDLGKLKPKADIAIFISYAPAKKAYRIYNKRTHLVIETIHVDFDELIAMASE
ncbi:retrovirus-related pol polyprotein from transposon TNT 1-94 [Tanacetum coccineum]